MFWLPDQSNSRALPFAKKQWQTARIAPDYRGGSATDFNRLPCDQPQQLFKKNNKLFVKVNLANISLFKYYLIIFGEFLYSIILTILIGFKFIRTCYCFRSWEKCIHPINFLNSIHAAVKFLWFAPDVLCFSFLPRHSLQEKRAPLHRSVHIYQEFALEIFHAFLQMEVQVKNRIRKLL